MKLFCLLITLCFAFGLEAQTPSKPNATLDKDGNYQAVKSTVVVKGKTSAKETGKTFTDRNGKVYPVMVSKNGKHFVIKTSATGTTYNYYLKLPGE